ncbi:hypothetical protein EII29_02420 [Leptotrichia sp. OH3620_COT-345]|uniref:conjugal transfer protein TraD n=1 Tax=Leptotrichia sp. OH3620_COT-345 TaxID=2491048 RepID=UPI000F64AD71|nr:conjugal transfer protein TraD [Leptotrichia sp. OH3620_COT-345]RRD40353.1 hypothetical protein EII29_02420 [Leptotrichia sp. OH3620_COT-345]
MTNIEKEVIKILQKNRAIKEPRTRKERQHHLVKKGAIFEMLGIDDMDEDFLLGVLLKVFDMSDEEKEKTRSLGNKFKIKRNQLRKQMKESGNNE